MQYVFLTLVFAVLACLIPQQTDAQYPPIHINTAKIALDTQAEFDAIIAKHLERQREIDEQIAKARALLQFADTLGGVGRK